MTDILAISMNQGEVKIALQENIDRIVVVTFGDGIVCKVRPLTVDDEGFVYHIEVDLDKASPLGAPCWTRFENVVRIEPTGEES